MFWGGPVCGLWMCVSKQKQMSLVLFYLRLADQLEGTRSRSLTCPWLGVQLSKQRPWECLTLQYILCYSSSTSSHTYSSLFLSELHTFYTTFTLDPSLCCLSLLSLQIPTILYNKSTVVHCRNSSSDIPETWWVWVEIVCFLSNTF